MLKTFPRHNIKNRSVAHGEAISFAVGTGVSGPTKRICPPNIFLNLIFSFGFEILWYLVPN